MTLKPSLDLQGARILILEDDYYLATDMQAALESVGAHVMGPFGDAADAEVAIEQDMPDCAFVDINLGHGPSFELPRALVRGNVPFSFITGYNAHAIPADFERSARIEKPCDMDLVAKMAQHMLRQVPTTRT